MENKIKYFLILLLIALSTTSYAQERSDGWNIQKRAEMRAVKRFTLKEWMENKDRRALMDLWLSINSPSPYEISLSGAYLQYDINQESQLSATKTARKSLEGSFSAYATLIGVTAEYQNNVEEGFNEVTGLFNVRVFGHTLQGTHLTLHYGLKTRTSNSHIYRLNQNFPAATLQLYMTKYFGIQGHYRHYLPTSESYYGETQGDELQAGPFIDFGAVRVFGDWYQQRQTSELNSQTTTIQRTGTKVGIKIYF